METLAALISWLVFGLIAGAIARFLMPGPQPMGCLMTSILGIIGSFVGGAISYAIWGMPGEGDWIRPSGWIMSIVGAIIVLALVGFISRRRGV